MPRFTTLRSSLFSIRHKDLSFVVILACARALGIGGTASVHSNSSASCEELLSTTPRATANANAKGAKWIQSLVFSAFRSLASVSYWVLSMQTPHSQPCTRNSLSRCQSSANRQQHCVWYCFFLLCSFKFSVISRVCLSHFHPSTV